MPAQVGENIHHDSVVAIQPQPCASNRYYTTVSELHVVCSLVLCKPYGRPQALRSAMSGLQLQYTFFSLSKF